MRPTNTIRFFEALSHRLRHENDLSDMVYALCASNPQFKQFFLNFFFPDKNLKKEEVSINREVSYDDGSRPDFEIRSGDDIYFVEAKIWDRNHHFGQYAQTLSHFKGYSSDEVASHLGYITNYAIKKSELLEADQGVFDKVSACRGVRTWQEFRAELEKCAGKLEDQYWATGEDIQGFVVYCKKVCPSNAEIVDAFVLRKEDCQWTKDFYGALGAVLESRELEIAPGKKVNIQFCRKNNKPSEWIGMEFSVENLLEEKIWGWMGCYLYAQAEAPGLCIDFQNQNGGGAPIFKHWKGTDRWVVEEPQIDYCYSIATPSNDELMRCLKDALAKIAGGRLPDDVNDIVTPQHLRNMRRMNLFLEQQVIGKVVLAGVGGRRILEVADVPDSQDPQRWSGVSFNLVENNGKVRDGGWMGVYFDNRKIDVEGEGQLEADGSWLVLEFGGKKFKLAGSGDWTAEVDRVREKAKDALCKTSS